MHDVATHPSEKMNNAFPICISHLQPQLTPSAYPTTNFAMAFLHSFPSLATAASAFIALLIALPHSARSQVPTVTSCLSQLLPLSPCLPFVQGRAHTPAQTCCLNLKRVYTARPLCLCLLVNGTSMSTMPINSTLAQQLPVVCDLKADASQCSGAGAPAPPGRVRSPVSLGSHTNSTVAASPMVVPGALGPASNIEQHNNADATMNTKGQFAVLAAGFAMFAMYYT